MTTDKDSHPIHPSSSSPQAQPQQQPQDQPDPQAAPAETTQPTVPHTEPPQPQADDTPAQPHTHALQPPHSFLVPDLQNPPSPALDYLNTATLAWPLQPLYGVDPADYGTELGVQLPKETDPHHQQENIATFDNNTGTISVAHAQTTPLAATAALLADKDTPVRRAPAGPPHVDPVRAAHHHNHHHPSSDAPTNEFLRVTPTPAAASFLPAPTAVSQHAFQALSSSLPVPPSSATAALSAPHGDKATTTVPIIASSPDPLDISRIHHQSSLRPQSPALLTASHGLPSAAAGHHHPHHRSHPHAFAAAPAVEAIKASALSAQSPRSPRPARHKLTSQSGAVGALRRVLTGEHAMVMPPALASFPTAKPPSATIKDAGQGPTSTLNDLAYLNYIESKLIESIKLFEARLSDTRSGLPGGRSRRVQRRTLVSSDGVHHLQPNLSQIHTGNIIEAQRFRHVHAAPGSDYKFTTSHESDQNLAPQLLRGDGYVPFYSRQYPEPEGDMVPVRSRQRVISVSFKLPSKADREGALLQTFDSRLPNKAMFRLEEDAKLPFVWVGSTDPPNAEFHGTSRFLELYNQAPLKRWRSSENEDSDDLHPNKSRFVPVALPNNPELLDSFHTFCDKTLWNMLHNDYSSFSFNKSLTDADPFFNAYRVINECFAEAVSEIYEEGDLIWIHNYQLMLVPSMLRQRLWYGKIGFFFYSPFPSAEIFRILPSRVEILKGVLGADLVGFYNYDYSKQFASSCTRLLGVEGTPKGIEAEPRSSRQCEFGIYPAGIDVRELKSHIASSAVKARVADLRRRFGDMKIIVGIDRLDDAFAGIPLKLLAFERFLLDNPNWRGRVVLIQVATIQGKDLKVSASHRSEINEFIARINSEFGTFAFSPVHYITQDLDLVEVRALLCVGHVCMVTVSRDGMGLVPHQWTVCQHEGNNGPLILSEFSGAAASFATAIHVNPWDVDDVAEKILNALEMKEAECVMRAASAHKFVTTHTSSLWGLNFLEDLEQVEGGSISDSAKTTPPLDLAAVIHAFVQAQLNNHIISPSPSSPPASFGAATPHVSGAVPATSESPQNSLTKVTSPIPIQNNGPQPKGLQSSSRVTSRKKLIILDYDGTLVHFQAIAELLAPPAHILQLLHDLSEIENCFVVLMSGRDRSTLAQWFGQLNIFLTAEDGCFLRYPGEEEWFPLFRRTTDKDYSSRHHTDGGASSTSGGHTPHGTPHVSSKEFPVGTDLVEAAINKALGSSATTDNQDRDDTDVIGSGGEKETDKAPTALTSLKTNGDSTNDVPSSMLNRRNRHKWSVSSFGSQAVADVAGLSQWKMQVKPIMHHFAERTPGVILEEGDATMTWHYTDADVGFGRFQARDMQKQLESFLVQHLSIEVVSEEGNSRYHTRWVKVRPNGTDKSVMIEKVLEFIRDEAGFSCSMPGTGLASGTSSRSASHGSLSGATGPPRRVSSGGALDASAPSGNDRRPKLSDLGPVLDFLICIGDDRADEGLFDVLGDDMKLALLGLMSVKARIFTCKVGSGPTAAAATLESPQKVIDLLEGLCSAGHSDETAGQELLASFQTRNISYTKLHSFAASQ